MSSSAWLIAAVWLLVALAFVAGVVWGNGRAIILARRTKAMIDTAFDLGEASGVAKARSIQAKMQGRAARGRFARKVVTE